MILDITLRSHKTDWGKCLYVRYTESVLKLQPVCSKTAKRFENGSNKACFQFGTIHLQWLHT